MSKKLILKSKYNFDIEYSKQAEKFLETHQSLKSRINKAILNLPQSAKVEPLSGFDNRYRARVGDYRIIFDLYEDIFLIDIRCIDSRGQVYKHSRKD